MSDRVFLKACPFCESKRLAVAKNDPWRRIRCLNCNAIGPSGFSGPSQLKTNIYSIQLWNGRGKK